MRSTILILALVLSVAAPSPPSELPSETVGIYVHADPDTPPALLQYMQEEAESILEPLGVSWAWRSESDIRRGEVFSRVVTVRLKGSCMVSGEMPAVEPSAALGITHMERGEPLPYCELDCERIRAFLRHELGRRPGAAPPPLLVGRAWGRVLAHELYHALGETRAHGREGITKAHFTAKELLHAKFGLEPAAVALLKARIFPVGPKAKPQTLE
jgi:hypothetical protein